MASPRVPFTTYRIEGLPSRLTSQDLLQSLGLEDIKHKMLLSASRSEDIKSDHQHFTLTIPEEQIRKFSLTTSVSIDGKQYLLDKDFEGFTPLCSAPIFEDFVEIIALTGLAGQAFASWQIHDGSMWLRDVLPADLVNVRTHLYGYSSSLEKSFSTARLIDYTNVFAHSLHTYLQSNEKTLRPVVLVGHSLGCLIIKQMLVEYTSVPAFQPLTSRICSVVFFGPPHRGLETESLEELTRDKERHGLILDLGKSSTMLRELNEKFADVSRELKIVTCFELQTTPTSRARSDDPELWERTGPSKMMVDPNSACLYTTNETRIPIDKNHSRIAKLSKSDKAYQRLKAVLEDIVVVAQANSKSKLHRLNAILVIERVRAVIGPLSGFLRYSEYSESEDSMIPIGRACDFLGQLHGSLNADLLSLSCGDPGSIGHLMKSILETLEIFEAHVLIYQDMIELYQGYVAESGLTHLRDASYRDFVRRIEKSSRYAPFLSAARIKKLTAASSICLERLIRLLWLVVLNPGIIDDFERLKKIQSTDEDDLAHSVRKAIRTHAIASQGHHLEPIAGHLEEDILLVEPLIQKYVPQRSVEPFLVLIEERNYVIEDPKAKSGAQIKDAESKARDKIEKLTVVLQNIIIEPGDAMSPLTSSRSTLQCLGYQRKPTPGEYIILFRIPNPSSDFLVESLGTLYTRLNSKEFRPNLQQRFKLAKDICSSILHLHCWGWVHKDIRPENIVVITSPPGEESNPHLANKSTLVAHLGGFEVARPENDFSSITKTLQLQRNLYRHPQRQQAPSRPFTKTDDLYAIGIILLEIGIQRTIDKIFMGKIITALEKTGYATHPEAIARKIEEIAAAELPQRMGPRYAEAVRKCISGDFGVTYDDESKSRLSIAFQDVVIDELEHGCQV